MSDQIIKEVYNKSSADNYIVKGNVTAKFRGPENMDDDFLFKFKANVQKKIIRVFDIVLYKDIFLNQAELLQSKDQINSIQSIIDPISVSVEDEINVYFKEIVWQNVDFIRINNIDRALLLNPTIEYAYQEKGYTFGELKGTLVIQKSKVVTPNIDPKPVIDNSSIVTDESIVPAQTLSSNNGCFSLFTRFLPSSINATELPLMLNSGCLSWLLRLLLLLLLAFLLLRGCSRFSSTNWERQRDEVINKDSTLKIPKGDEKVLVNRDSTYFKDTQKVVKTNVNLGGGFVIKLRDVDVYDHDITDVKLNGRLIANDFEIKSYSQSIPLNNLRIGDNVIDFIVVSQGKYNLFTGEMLVVDTLNNKIMSKNTVINKKGFFSRYILNFK